MKIQILKAGSFQPKAIPNFNTGNGLKILLSFIFGLFIFHTSHAFSLFFADKTTILAGDTIQFTERSSVISQPTSWSWSFSGGNITTSSLLNPRVTYSTPGVYSVTLVTTYSLQPTSTLTQSGYITVLDASVGNDNAALTALIGPRKVDPGTHEVKVRLRNMGENSINSLTINWELNGVLQTPLSFIHPLDTFRGLASWDTILTLGTVILPPNSTIFLRAWTSAPNGTTDSQSSNDTIIFMLKPKLSGTYTIGGINPDFPTLKDAVRGLKSDYGIGGPVEFNLRNGIYNEQISLDSITGTSPANTVLFKSENNDQSLVTITYAPSSAIAILDNYTLEVKNSNYISFKHLTIKSAGTANANAFVITGTSSFLLVEKCSITTIPKNTGLSYSVSPVSGTGLTGTDIIIKNNIITGGSIGIYLAGTNQTNPIPGGLIIDSNNFSEFGSYGSYIQYCSAPKFRYNTVTMAAATSASTIKAAHFAYCNNELEITNNKISGTGLSSIVFGISIENCNGSHLNYARVINNDIVLQTSGTRTHGIYSTTSGYTRYYHNSVHSFSSSINNYPAYFINSTNVISSIIVRNNVFANTGPVGYAMYVSVPAFINSDYNLLYSTSITGLFQVSSPGITYGSLNSYRMAFPTQEKNSLTYRPAFTSNTNLAPHTGDTASWLMNGTGTHTFVTSDILGNNIPMAAIDGAPDMGAYQFTPTVPAPRANPVPAIAIAGQSQAFMYGSDTLAIIEWDALSAMPTMINVMNYTDSAIADYPAQLQLRSFMKVNMIPFSSSYLYNIKYFYRTPLTGNITNEQDLSGAKLTGNNWYFYSGSSTILDTLKNTLKAAYVSDNTFTFTGTDNWLPLPVKLISFDAKVQGKDVLLNWSTASETNNRDFELQRSVDGRNFSYAYIIKGTGNSNNTTNYNLVDKNAFVNSQQPKANSGILYYRLKQINSDGEFNYSHIVRVSEHSQSIHSVSIAPNPYSETFSVLFNSISSSEVSVEVMDIQGKVLIKQSAAVMGGLNTVFVNESSNLRSGVYFVRLNMNGETQVLKLVKN
jgi:PKD repeat protein